jgi:5-methylcytosine-specific restriction endonuclease McrA
VCRKCKVEKPLDQFGPDKRQKLGIRNECKTCYAAYMREWSRNNSKSVNARVRKYHAANKDELNLKRAHRAKRNVEQTNAARARWAKMNPEKMRESRVKSLHKRRQTISSDSFQVPVSRFVRMRKKPCVYCGAVEKIEIDHVVPLYRGGSNSEGNLVPACASCNRSKGYKFVMEWKLKRLKLERLT